jgi:cytochrome oxidase Cu insertion factor (SCO1/SenC/PrrC family)
MKRLIFHLAFCYLFFSCASDTDSRRLIIPEKMNKETQLHGINKQILIYYHPGDCSICYGNILSLSNEFDDLPLLSISASENSEVVKYYLDQISFRGISLNDSNSEFLKANYELLNSYNIFLVDSQYRIQIALRNSNKEIVDKIRSLVIPH